jgi:hypothetical protein
MRNHFKFLSISFWRLVFCANAGSYDDFFTAIKRDDAGHHRAC